jgi:hypothetical protein
LDLLPQILDAFPLNPGALAAFARGNGSGLCGDAYLHVSCGLLLAKLTLCAGGFELPVACRVNLCLTAGHPSEVCAEYD